MVDKTFTTDGLITDNKPHFDAGSSYNSGGATSTTHTWSHTVGDLPQRLLVVCFGIGSSTVTGITYNGVALTKIQDVTNALRTEMWYLIAPDVGTHNIVVSIGANIAGLGGAISAYGIRQSGTVIETTNTHTATINGNGASDAISYTTTRDNTFPVFGVGKDSNSTFISGGTSTQASYVVFNPPGALATFWKNLTLAAATSEGFTFGMGGNGNQQVSEMIAAFNAVLETFSATFTTDGFVSGFKQFTTDALMKAASDKTFTTDAWVFLADSPACEITSSNYKWMTQTLLDAQQRFNVRPFFKASIVDDSVIPNEVFGVPDIVNGNPVFATRIAKGSMVTAPDDAILTVGEIETTPLTSDPPFGGTGTGTVGFWKITDGTDLTQWQTPAFVLDTTSVLPLFNANIGNYSIQVSDYINGTYRIDVYYFVNFTGDSTTLKIKHHWSDDGGTTWSNEEIDSGIPNDIGFGLFGGMNIFVAAGKPVRQTDSSIISTFFYLTRATYPDGYYRITRGTALTGSGSWTLTDWSNKTVDSGDWILHSLDVTFKSGVYHLVFSGYHALKESVNQTANNQLGNTSLYATALRDLTLNSWDFPTEVLTSLSSSDANQNSFFFPKLTYDPLRKMTYMVFSTVTVASIKSSAQTSSIIVKSIRYMFSQSKDFKNFNYPTQIVFTDGTPFPNAVFDESGDPSTPMQMSYTPQDIYFYLGTGTRGGFLWQFIENDLAADVTDDVIQYSVKESAGQPSNLSLQVGNQNNKWYGPPFDASEDFEEYTDGDTLAGLDGGEGFDTPWATDLPGWLITDLQSFTGFLSAAAVGITSGQQTTLSRTFQPISIDGTVFTFHIKVDGSPINDSPNQIRDANGFAMLNWRISATGNARISGGGGYDNIFSLAPGVWRTFQVKAFYSTRMFQWQIDGGGYSPLIPFFDFFALPVGPSVEINIISMDGGTNEMYIDDIIIDIPGIGSDRGALTKNKKIYLHQGFYNAEGDPETVPRNVFFIDDIRQNITFRTNDLIFSARDFYKKLKVTITKYAYNFIGPKLYYDSFDGTTFGNWTQKHANWAEIDNAMHAIAPLVNEISNPNTDDPSTGGVILLSNSINLSESYELAVTFKLPNPAVNDKSVMVYVYWQDDNNWVRFRISSTTSPGGAHYIMFVEELIDGSVTSTLVFDTNSLSPAAARQLYWTVTEDTYALHVRKRKNNVLDFALGSNELDGGGFGGNNKFTWDPASTPQAPRSLFAAGTVDLAAATFVPFYTLVGSVGLGYDNFNPEFQAFKFIQYGNTNNISELIQSISTKGGIFDFKPQQLFEDHFFDPVPYTGTFTSPNRVLTIEPGNVVVRDDTTIDNGEVEFEAQMVTDGTATQYGFRVYFRRQSSTASYIWELKQQAEGVISRFFVLVSGTEYLIYENTPVDYVTGSAIDPIPVDLTVFHTYKLVFSDGFMYAFIDGRMICGWNDTNTTQTYSTGGIAFASVSNGPSTDVVRIKKVSSGSFWHQIPTISLNPGDDMEQSVDGIVQTVRGWNFSDLFGRLKSVLLNPDDESSYTYEDQLYVQNVDNSDKEYVNQVSVYGSGVAATSRDDESIGQQGVVREHVVVDYKITTFADAKSRADFELVNQKKFSTQSRPKQINNVGAELFDVATIINTGPNSANTSAPVRVYDQGIAATGQSEYSIELDTGNL